jgi:hypothetical protein
MKRASAFFLVLTLGLFVAGSASAGYLEVTYDLAGSTVTTTTPLGVDVDPLTGTLVVRFGATTALAPITSATLVGGNTFVSINQPGIFTITGTSNTVLSPGAGVAATGLGANAVTFPAIPASINGFLHCIGSTALCNLGQFVASVASPITGSAATLPALVFAGGVANGGFLGSLTSVITQPVTVTAVTQYVGTETGRIFVPEPGGLALMGSGIAGLALLGALRRRRNG